MFWRRYRICRRRKRGSGFASSDARRDGVFYDLEFDRDVIEASFAMQYGIRLSREDILLPEFLRLLSGIMPDTPLGRVVAVRAERDAEVLKGFGEPERKIRREWTAFLGRDAVKDEGFEELQGELRQMFGRAI